MRSKLPPLICFFCGVVLLIQFFVPWDPIEQNFLEWVGNSMQVVGVFALAIGVASLVHMHGNKIKRRSPGWAFSIVTLFCVVIVATIGLVPSGCGPTHTTPSHAKIDASKTTNVVPETTHTLFGFQSETTVSNIVVAGVETALVVRSVPMFDWFYNYIFFPLSATTFSLLAFYMMTATYRAVRVKSWEAGLLLGAAIIVLLGQVPIEQLPIVGKYVACGEISGISTFEYLKSLILQFPNTAAKRGIIIGIALGALATSIKIIFGIERPYMGGQA